MGTYVAAGTTSRRGSIAPTAITVALIGALALGVGFAIGRGLNEVSFADSGRALTRVHPGYGTGYPLHGGLAGPSRLEPRAEHPGYGTGYPQHGGLAGPSRSGGQAEHPGYGVGYPLHGGLAGPSRLSVER